MIGRRRDDAQSFDEAWSGRAPRDEQVAQLVRFAETLCEAAVAEPTAQFRLSLRESLMTEARTALVPAASSPRTVTAAPSQRPVRRRVAGLTAAALASAGVVGLVSSSASAVPGEMLYSVKRSVESVQLALHRGDASRGSYQLAQASERLAEARELSNGPSPVTESLIASTLDDFSSQAESGSNDLFEEFVSKGEEQSVQKVSDFTAAAATELATLSAVLPESAEDSLALAAKTIGDLAIEASSLCASCASADAQSLVNAVTALTEASPTADGASATMTPKSTTTTQKAKKPSGTSASTPASGLPTAPVSSDVPIDLAPVTDPLLGGLLGDEGLVPNVLNGLLGGSK